MRSTAFSSTRSGMLAVQPLADGAALDAAGIAGVVVEHRCSALLPVMRTLSALTTTTLSPQSTCGVNCGLCLPRRRLAMMTARRPSTTPSASISTQSFFTSAGFSERVVFSIAVGSMRSGGGVWSEMPVGSRVPACGIIIPQQSAATAAAPQAYRARPGQRHPGPVPNHRTPMSLHLRLTDLGASTRMVPASFKHLIRQAGSSCRCAASD